MSPVAWTGVACGVVLGVVPLFAVDDAAAGPETLVFVAMIVAVAVIPYLVFARVERRWSRPLAIAVLGVLVVAHVAVTASLLASLDDDPLNGIGFLTVPPLLAAAVGVIGLGVALARALAERRR